VVEAGEGRAPQELKGKKKIKILFLIPPAYSLLKKNGHTIFA
jgi:hypothetical protein